MSTVTVANTSLGLSLKTLDVLESDQTITGLKTFSRGAQSPFAVAVGSTVVTNLDADKVDGVDIATLAANRIPYAASATSLTNGSGLTFDGTTLTAVSNTLTAALFTLAGGQIAFPATQVPSANVNTLDDYEEGTWTPAVTFGGGSTGITYTTRGGWYVKIGKLVSFGGQFQLSSKGSSTGNAAITGLPFTSETDATNGFSAVSVARYIGFSAAVIGPTGYIDSASSAVSLATGTAAGVTSTILADTHFTNTSQFTNFSGMYRASA